MDQFVIETDIDILDEMQKAFNNKSIVALKDVCWFYLKEIPALTNPETGEVVTAVPMTLLRSIPVGTDGDCRGDHATFFDKQNIPIQEINIPNIAENLFKVNKIWINDGNGKNLIKIRSVNAPHPFISSCMPSKEIYFELIKIEPFIEEILDWDDLRTPEDEDNPRPRLKALELI